MCIHVHRWMLLTRTDTHWIIIPLGIIRLCDFEQRRMGILQAINASFKITVLLGKFSDICLVDVSKPFPSLLAEIADLLAKGAKPFGEALTERSDVL